jgi:hypothetical protein
MPHTRHGQEGFALVLSILILTILTFLGLALAATTSTEVQVATNFRRSQQALYAAEAGLEVGRRILRDAQWPTVLPPARAGRWTVACAASSLGSSLQCTLQGAIEPRCPGDKPCPRTSTGIALRDLEAHGCDVGGSHVGYGAVLLEPGGPPLQDRDAFGGDLPGASYTLWVRRPTSAFATEVAGVDEHADATDDDALVLTAEGVVRAAGARAVRVMEATLDRRAVDAQDCAPRAGQEGGGPEGSGFSGCAGLDGAGVAAQLGGAGDDRSVR